jgi:hypothetical protein
VDLQKWCLWFKRRGAGRLRRILRREWDPIGIGGVALARDEYDSYLGPIADRLRRDASSDEIAALLQAIRCDRMGLHAHPEADLHAAEVVRRWYASEMGRLRQQ